MGKRFSKINIEISNICNLQCSFCPEVIRDKKKMSVELFQKIIPQVAPLTDQVCFHLMGDPLVHPDLEKFVEICAENDTKVFLVTNGVLLQPKQAEILLHPVFRQVNFSLHSFADNYGDKDPSIYLERIFSYVEKAFELRPDLYINFRLWNLQSAAGTTTANKRILEEIEKRFDVKTPAEVNVREQKSIKLKNRLYLHFDTEFTWPALDLPILGTEGRCYGLSSHFGILVDGTVVPCCLDKEGAIPLGKVSEQPILEILNSSRAQSLLKGFKAKKLVEKLCQRCQYIERFDSAHHH